MKSTEYEPCHCGDGCDLVGSDEGPCWGEVRAVAEDCWDEGDYFWVHACEGHAYFHVAGKYIPRPEKPAGSKLNLETDHEER